MSRLPQPGKDAGTWGDILNDYLSQAHTSDGSLKDNIVGASQLQDNAVTVDKLHSDITASLASKQDASSLETVIAAKIGSGGPLDGALDGQYAASVASRCGVTADVAANATAAINKFLSDRAAAGARYAEFDLPIALNTGALAAADVLLTGESVFATDALENWIRPIASKAAYIGKINRLSKQDQFSATKTAITNGSVNVCIFGDSIAYSGPTDMVGAGLTTGSGIESSPNGITYDASFVTHLRDRAITRWPNATWNFYNRSIGGSLLSYWNDARAFNSVTKAWIEHVKDTAPDLLVIAFGMNHDTYDRAAEFTYRLHQVLDYVGANFPKQPDIVVVTPPRPSTMPAWVMGQITRHTVANAIRNRAAFDSYYVMDAGKLSDLRRIGADWSRPIAKARTGLSSAWSLSSGASYNSGSDILSLNSSQSKVALPALAKDFTLQFTLNAGSVDASEGIAVKYNIVDSTHYNLLTILPKTSSNLVVQSYSRNACAALWGASPTVSYTAPAVTSKRFRIEKRCGMLEVYMNEALILRDSLDTWDSPGTFSIERTSTTTANTLNLYQIQLYTAEYPMSMPSLLEREMFGVYDASDTANTKQPYGGNGFNHPSSIGLQTVYVPVVDELITDIAS